MNLVRSTTLAKQRSDTLRRLGILASGPQFFAVRPLHLSRRSVFQARFGQSLPLTASMPVSADSHAHSRVEPQRVDAPLTQSATFLVLTLTDSPGAAKTVRSVLANITDLNKNVSIRDPFAALNCTVGIGADAWDRIMAPVGLLKPPELHPFRVVRGAVHTAPSTPGDLIFHIRSERRDMNFEFERQLLDALGDSVSVADETIGFRYFDVRDLLGFVDGTANPATATQISKAVLVASDDGDSADLAATGAVGGSYVVVQKYVHDMKAWRSLSSEAQEAIIGRTKWDNVELADADDSKQKAHKTLANITDDDGTEHSILRDNMPFGSPASGQFGTYFIGYSRHLWVIERMLERMFIGDPPGLHDRLLDYSSALTGSVFFVPSATTLQNLDKD
ncbi:hypothetical protein B0T24DRAFT_133 [Lasiosphaeria ovina]|uniref:Dyp-type peroxidase n=1 Tax=Lasiosphaeria ovina TaxID=92902 RepID=A0AAE0TWF5_9PEZI|nr:hypothetical protein B0T24DRAFT_133 [Lasiosphaeria ovina]